MNIDCTDTQFDDLMRQIDADGDLSISHQEFLMFMKESEKKSFTEQAVGQVAPTNVDQCIVSKHAIPTTT